MYCSVQARLSLLPEPPPKWDPGCIRLEKKQAILGLAGLLFYSAFHFHGCATISWDFGYLYGV